jgi:dTDP-4-amino-4,6-dideoxygalactose transaminase
VRIWLSPPHLSGREQELVAEAFASNWIAPLGPFVDRFEAELSQRLEGRSVVALSSGTAALHLALLLAGVGPGDEVLVPTLTFSASANPVLYLGARPVFVDADATSWQVDPELVAGELRRRAADGRRPAAVVTVDLYGQCADYDRIVAACEEYDVPLVEDAAEALGADYRGRPAGAFGALGVLSFNGNKVITTSGGGALVASDPAVAERARFLATQARDPAPHYEHSVIGYNYRLSNLLAAVGVGQLEVLDDRVRRRREHNAFYRERLGSLPGIGFMPETSYGTSSWWLTCISVEPEASGTTTTEIRESLLSHDIEARPVWKPLHLQPVFRDCERVGGAVAEQLFETGLCLPSGSSLTDAEREEVADRVAACIRG